MLLYICPKRLGLAFALGTLLLLEPSIGYADLLPVQFYPNSPVVSGSGGSLTYNSTTGDFDVTLTSRSLVYAAPFVLPRGFALFNGSLSIDLDVDKNGNFVANGTGVELTGTVIINGTTFTGTPANPLLTGDITAFGSEAAGPPTRTFDGLFTIDGGLLTAPPPPGSGAVFGGFPLGATGGFLLSAENATSGTLGDFIADFKSSSVKPSVGVATPEPSSLALVLAAAGVLGAWGLRRKRRPQARATDT